MKRTKLGNAGNVFDRRTIGQTVKLPQTFGSVGLDIDGESWLIEGTRDEMVAAIKAASYRVAQPDDPDAGLDADTSGYPEIDAEIDDAIQGRD